MNSLLVMAAGMGTRFGGLKQMEAMGPHGETMLDYSVFDALQAGFQRVIFVIRADFSQVFQCQVGARYRGLVDIDYVHQDPNDLPDGLALPAGRVKPWGTLHAVWSARHTVTGPFAAINADDFYGRDAYVKVAGFLNATSNRQTPHKNYCMVGYRIANTLSGHGGVNRGICVERQGLLATVEEYKNIAIDEDGVCRGNNLAGQRLAIPAQAVSSMNLWGFTPEIFEQMGQHFSGFLRRHGSSLTAESYIPDVMDELIRAGQAECHVLPTDGKWFGVTYPQDKPACVKNLANLVSIGVYPPSLFKLGTQP